MQSLTKSFKHAFEGIVFCIKNERNFRIHLSFVLSVGIFAWFYGVNKSEYLTLIFTVALVLITEMINTAIEKAVDFYTKGYSLTAKIAKDVSAASVFVAAFISVIVGVLIFDDREKWIKICGRFLKEPIAFLLLLVYVCLMIKVCDRNFGFKKSQKTTVFQNKRWLCLTRGRK